MILYKALISQTIWNYFWFGFTKSIGLTNEAQIYKIIKFSKILFFLAQITSITTVPLISFLSFLIPFCKSQFTLETIVIGIPHSIIWYIFSHNISSIISWQIVYFFLMCYYMKYKISSINKNLIINLKSSKIFQSSHLIDLIILLNSLYLEINDYNSNFWSKFLFLILVTFSAISDSLLYSTIFGRMDLFSRILLILFISSKTDLIQLQ
jgi:hypothetical protein